MIKTILHVAVVLCGTLIIAACGPDSGLSGGGSGAIQDSGGIGAIQDREAYFDSLSAAVSSNVETTSSAFFGATAASTSVPGLVATGIDTGRSMLRSTGFASIFDKTQARTGRSGSQGGQYLDMLEEYGSVTDTSMGLLFQPDPSLLCTSEMMDDINACTSLANGASVQFTQSSSSSGTVTFLFESDDVFTLEYSNNSMTMRLNLTNMKTLVQTVDADADLPSTFSGQIKMAITAATGDSSGWVKLSIPEGISIGDSAYDYQFDLAQTDNLFEVEGDDETGTGSMSMDLTSLVVSFPDEDSTSGGRYNINVPKLWFDLTGDDKSTAETNDDELTVKAFLDSSGIQVTHNAEKLLEVSGFTLDASMSGGVLTMNDYFDLAVTTTDATNELKISVENGTKMQTTENCGGASGTFVPTGGVSFNLDLGEDSGDTSIEINAVGGQCFTDEQ